ncbi:MAG TPA: DUF4397 domain-containing protein [Terriglobales bacterium]|nr:DUF4397 domain-containing protein [Terriglobales bacterium]
MNATPDQTSISATLDSTSIASAITYGASSTYSQTNSGARHLQVQGSAAAVFLDQTVTLAGGTSNTAIIANQSATSNAVLLTDDNTASTTTGNFKLRIVNASPGMGTVDVYVLSSGTPITDSTPTIPGLGFESSSQYMDMPAGSYSIVFTSPGSLFARFNTGDIAFVAGQNRTIVGLDSTTGNFTIGTLKDLN